MASRLNPIDNTEIQKTDSQNPIGFLGNREIEIFSPSAAPSMLPLIAAPESAAALPEVSQITLLTPESRRTIVERICAALTFWYIDEAIANKMAGRIADHLSSGNYDHYKSPIEFAKRLQDDIRSIYDDRHIILSYDEKPCPPDDPIRMLKDVDPENLSREEKEGIEARIEADIVRLNPWIHSEIRGCIGYLKIDSFPPTESPTACAKIKAAMQTIAEADSLIIDLSDNGGGDPHAVALLYSYLVDKRELLNQMYWRSRNRWNETFADPSQTEGKTFGGKKPIVCITSERTFSAGEELAYDLQQSGRGVVIGQITGGGAHPGDYFAVDDHLVLFIPRGKAINPHSGTNWEGCGVQPNTICTLENGNAIRAAEDLLNSLSAATP